MARCTTRHDRGGEGARLGEPRRPQTAQAQGLALRAVKLSKAIHHRPEAGLRDGPAPHDALGGPTDPSQPDGAGLVCGLHRDMFVS